MKFDTLKSDLQEELSHRSSEIDFEDELAIKNTILFFDWWQKVDPARGVELYKRGFLDPLKKIKWLNAETILKSSPTR